MKIVWTELAEQRLAEAFAHIAVQGPKTADSWLERLLREVARLEEFPDSGYMVPESGRDDVRQLLVRPYRVVYRRERGRVVVLTVRHCRRSSGRGGVE